MNLSKVKQLRILMAVVGVLVSSMGMGMIRTSLFGSAPFQCFLEGIASMVPFGYGALYILFNCGLMVLAFFLGRRYIGVTTFVNWFFFGYGIEYTEKAILYLVGTPTMPLRIALLVVGLVILSFSVAMYIVADLGVSAYDSLALIMADYNIAKFRYCRMTTDIVSTLAGYLLGSIVGLGTLITAFFMGPLIDVFRTYLFEPFLARYQKEA